MAHNDASNSVTRNPLEDYGDFKDAEQTPEQADTDQVSDPAKDDSVGTDWTDEGGATPEGPATAVSDNE